MNYPVWTSSEKDKLKSYYLDGKNDTEIAGLLDRTLSTVMLHRQQLGLKRKRVHNNTPVALPSHEFLHQKLKYLPDTGVLLLKEADQKRSVGDLATYLRKPPRDGQLPYLIVKLDGRIYMAHRVIYKMMTGRDPADLIDHKDGNSINNRWDNLRDATQVENARNRKANHKNKTGLKRVTRTRGGKWTATVSLGVFETKEDAAAAYNLVASKLYGEFFRPNAPLPAANDNTKENIEAA